MIVRCDRCHHQRGAHDYDGPCLAAPGYSTQACTCPGFRPPPSAGVDDARGGAHVHTPRAGVVPSPEAAPARTPNEPRELIAAGRTSDRKGTRDLAARITRDLVDLHRRVTGERDRGQRRARVVQMDEQAATERARIRARGGHGGATPRPTTCPDCGQSFDSPQAMGGHRRTHRAAS